MDAQALADSVDGRYRALDGESSTRNSRNIVNPPWRLA
jgi:hypothetical protein